MNKREIAKWYHDNGMEYIPSDYGERDAETGESLDRDSGLGRERYKKSTRVSRLNPEWLGEHEVGSIWPPRGEHEAEEIQALSEFFTPYFARLPLAKTNLLIDYFGQRRTQGELAEETGRTQQAVSSELHTAIRALVHLVALDDPDYAPPVDGRKRPFAAESEAAERVLNAWWEEKFGRPRLV